MREESAAVQPPTQQHTLTDVLCEILGSYAFHWSPPSSVWTGLTVVPPHFAHARPKRAASLIGPITGTTGGFYMDFRPLFPHSRVSDAELLGPPHTIMAALCAPRLGSLPVGAVPT